MQYRKLFITGMMLFSWALGCQQNQPVVARGISAEERARDVVLSKENQTIFLDQNLAEQLRLADYQVTRNDIGMLVVATQMQTVVDNDVAVSVKCKFIHNTGKLEETPWEPKIIRRHEAIPVVFTSLSPDAAKYQVYVRISK